jgi:hypothetical protein
MSWIDKFRRDPLDKSIIVNERLLKRLMNERVHCKIEDLIQLAQGRAIL